MLENKDIEKLIYQEWALKALELLPQEKKDELILNGLYRQLSNSDFKWEVRKVFDKYAEAHVGEYLSTPEFQERIKEQARKAVDATFDKLLEELAIKFPGDLKWIAEVTARKMGKEV